MNTKNPNPEIPVIPVFQLGQVVLTPGALQILGEYGMPLLSIMQRHARGDWGDLDDDDKKANRLALKTGARLMSAYQLGVTGHVAKIWVITEAENDEGVRASTCVLLPEEY